eukprot:TRINITY_DN41145_c0_g1_i2.p1 TRINITY_DN41145_c0_g1~~TRINITY_DN41145_c0_g1_i2.p1  ORF type:complete len:162 (-),score=31.74 TRINITY_DN41145_c0_g1_i2:292-777(-)
MVRPCAMASCFEEVLGFLHSVPTPATLFTIEHEAGEMRVSGNHLLFVQKGAETKEAVGSEIRPGDLIPTGEGGLSMVLSVRRDMTESGLLAPLTSSGSIVVDHATASTYATTSHLQIPHAAMHAAFFAIRALHQLPLQGYQQPGFVFEMPTPVALLLQLVK